MEVNFCVGAIFANFSALRESECSFIGDIYIFCNVVKRRKRVQHKTSSGLLMKSRSWSSHEERFKGWVVIASIIFRERQLHCSFLYVHGDCIVNFIIHNIYYTI